MGVQAARKGVVQTGLSAIGGFMRRVVVEPIFGRWRIDQEGLAEMAEFLSDEQRADLGFVGPPRPSVDAMPDASPVGVAVVLGALLVGAYYLRRAR